MQRPAPTWECDYAADRREHHHRCLCCNKIIGDGERVLMHRAKKGTRAAHIACADRQHVPDHPETTREVMRLWGLAALKRQGWHVPELA